MIDPAGLILTTSRNLSQAPVADFVTGDGATGQAWVVGRDDNRDIALLRIVDPIGEYLAIEVASGSIQIDDRFARLSYTGVVTPTLDKQETVVVGIQTDLNTGIRYIQIDAPPQSGAEGGALIDNDGRLRGLRMTEAHMISLGFGRVGQVYVIGSGAINQLILPNLRAGVVTILREESELEDPDNPGPLPIFPANHVGVATIGGQLPGVEGRIYARVTKPGLQDVWVSTILQADGAFLLPIALDDAYNNGTVEFWTQAKRATQVNVYTSGKPVVKDLTFP